MKHCNSPNKNTSDGMCPAFTYMNYDKCHYHRIVELESKEEVLREDFSMVIREATGGAGDLYLKSLCNKIIDKHGLKNAR